MIIPKYKLFILAIAGVIIGSCLTGCSDEPSGGEEITGIHSVYLPSRSTDESKFSTYRVSVFNLYSYRYINSGTYATWEYGDTEILTPWKLDENGNRKTSVYNDPENSGATLEAGAGNFLISCVSPGIPCDNNGAFRFNPSAGPFYATNVERVALGSYGLVNLSEQILDRRSKVRFRIWKDTEIIKENIVVTDFMFIGAGDSIHDITYYPAQKQVVPPAEPMNIELSSPVTEQTNGTKRLEYETVKKFIAAAYYCSRNDVYEELQKTKNNPNTTDFLIDGKSLSVKFSLKQGERAPIDVNIELPIRCFEPLHEYCFDFVVKSEIIELSVIIHSCGAHPWGWHPDNLDEWEIGGSNPETIMLGVWKLGEQSGNWTYHQLTNPEIN